MVEHKSTSAHKPVEHNKSLENASKLSVPSAVSLAAAKAAKDKEANSRALKNKSKMNSVYIGVAVVVLVAVIAFFVFFSGPTYKFSFNINGVKFVSNEYTPSEFLPKFKDNNTFVVAVDIKEGEQNAWVVNSMNLWLVALNADGKKVHSLVRTIDSKGAVKSCATNDANILSQRDLSVEECSAILADSNSKGIVTINLSNTDSAVMSSNRIDVYASGTKTVSHANYFVIKEMYPNFDKTLEIVNERINSIN